MRVALDASYSIDPQPTGIAVYSRKLLDGLPPAYPTDCFVHCYRAKAYKRAPRSAFANVTNRLLAPPLPTFRADVFHALNQRVDRRPARFVIATFHDLFVMTGEYSTPEFRARFTAQARRAADNADLIIAVSEFTASQVSSLLKVERSRIRVIPHGVDLPPSQPTAKREAEVLFVGAIQARKNIVRLVEAFESMPKPWRLVLAGAPNGYNAQQALTRIEQSPSRDRIEVTGYVNPNRLRELLARASIFAFPSLDEGFGIPVLEAMAWGIPVVTSNSSALKEIAEGAALLVDPYNVPAIAEAFCKLSENNSLRQDLVAAGLERAKKFLWRDAVRRTYGVYKEGTA